MNSNIAVLIIINYDTLKFVFMQLFLTKNLKIIIIVSDWLGKTAGQSVQIAVNQPKRAK